MPKKQILDAGSQLTIGITLVLFVVALFAKGLTHDLLLEAGVFLVSAKLVILGYKNGIAADEIRSELRQIREVLERTGPQSR